MYRRPYTLDDLYQFCLDNNFSHFSAAESGAPLVVHELGLFQAEEAYQGLLPVTLQACHTELNRNNSYISEDVMNSALLSLHNKPILGYVVEKEDGTYDFHGHDMETRTDKDGNEYTYFLEQPIGCIPESCSARLEYDEEKKKTYVVAKGYIFDDYSNHAAQIIKEKGTVKVSVELYILDMSFSAKDKCLMINDFYFNGVTCLGSDVGEGMEGSNLAIADFSVKTTKNEDLMVELIDRLNAALSVFNLEEGGNEGVTKLEELMTQYGVTTEDITFETEGLSDEELEAKFKELFEKSNNSITCPECGVSVDDDATVCPECGASLRSNDDDDDNDDPADTYSTTKKYSVEINGETFTFETSLNEVIYTLENLVNATYGESDNTYYGVRVYESYLVMTDYWNGRYYRQGYSNENDSYSLTGDRVEVYMNFLTKEEEAQLQEMQANYSELKEYKENIENEKLRNAKMEILNNSCYETVSNLETFSELTSNIDNYSLDDLQIQADLILAKSVKETTKSAASKKLVYGFQENTVSYLDSILQKSKGGK